MLLIPLLFQAAVALAAPPDAIEVPITSFGRHGPMPVPAKLWLSKTKTDVTSYRAVLIVPPPGRVSELAPLGEAFEAAGFDSMLIEPRKEARQPQRTLVEDIQSGVAFMRTDPRIRASKVLIVALAESANAAAQYASANKQMVVVVDGLVLVNPQKEIKRMKLADALKQLEVPALLSSPQAKSLRALCPKVCTVAKLPASKPAQALKSNAVIDFLLRPHG